MKPGDSAGGPCFGISYLIRVACGGTWFCFQFPIQAAAKSPEAQRCRLADCCRPSDSRKVSTKGEEGGQTCLMRLGGVDDRSLNQAQNQKPKPKWESKAKGVEKRKRKRERKCRWKGVRRRRKGGGVCVRRGGGHSNPRTPRTP